MKQITPVSKLALALSYLAGLIILLLPLHAFITVWLAAGLGHYTLLRLWKEFLLLPIVLGALYLLYRDKPLRSSYFRLLIVRLILAYIVVLVICALLAHAKHAVSGKAMWYGLLVDLRFLVFFLSLLVISAKSGWLAARWQKLLLVPAILVAGFAILQYLVLPYDFLKHFGYGDSTISPYETINHNLQHIRVASTLRGANPLGAYLIMPISALAVGFVANKKQRLNIGIFGAGLFLALIFSFSRSAWVGALLAVASVAWLAIRSAAARRLVLWAATAAVVVLAGIGLLLRNNLSYQNFIFHTDKASRIAASSDQGHSAAFKGATHDIIHNPLGSGVGTAGPQSVYNDHPARIAENYYLQIGQEAGLLGMALFIAITICLGVMLWATRAEQLPLMLLVSLVGICFVNLLSHAWADDSLAYIWWGLAAIGLSPVIIRSKFKAADAKKIKSQP